MKINIEQTETQEEVTYKVEISEPKAKHPLVDRIHKAIMNLQESASTAREVRAKTDEDKLRVEVPQLISIPVIIAVAEDKGVPGGDPILKMEFATTFPFTSTTPNEPAVQNLWKAINANKLPTDLKKLIGKELHALIVAENGRVRITDFTK